MYKNVSFDNNTKKEKSYMEQKFCIVVKSLVSIQSIQL